MSQLRDVTDASFAAEVLEADRPVVVDFRGPLSRVRADRTAPRRPRAAPGARGTIGRPAREARP
jgi:hypothetical protein